MKKVLLNILSAILLCTAVLLTAGCDTETKQHAVLAVYDNFGREWCRLSEQEHKKEIEIPFDGKERTFRAELFSSDGDVLPQNENPTDTELVSFVSSDGLSAELPAAACETGSYFYCRAQRCRACIPFSGISYRKHNGGGDGGKRAAASALRAERAFPSSG